MDSPHGLMVTWADGAIVGVGVVEIILCVVFEGLSPGIQTT